MRRTVCMILVLLAGQMLWADYIIVGADSDTYTRFDDEFVQQWQLVGDDGVQISISPDTGDVYIGFIGDVVKRYDFETGFYIAPSSGSPYVAKHDLEWGYDFNGDGIQDVWTVKNDSALGYIQVYSGADLSENLASFGVAHTDSETLDGTGGRGCCFGPDLNDDGINDFYTAIGWNNEFCRINVWDPVALTTAGSDAEILAAQIASYPAGSLREPMDIIMGPDFNGDGQSDLWISNQYGNNLAIYDYSDGSQLGTSTLGGILSSYRQPRSLDIANGPNGTVLVTTRFATSLDPDYVSGVETKKGNLLQYDPLTDTTILLYGSFDIGRIDSVVYVDLADQCPEPPQADLTDDCRVDMDDLLFMLSQWLMDTDPTL